MCCRASMETWTAALVEQRHLSNALRLWKRFVDKNAADLVSISNFLIILQCGVFLATPARVRCDFLSALVLFTMQTKVSHNCPKKQELSERYASSFLSLGTSKEGTAKIESPSSQYLQRKCMCCRRRDKSNCKPSRNLLPSSPDLK